MSIATPQSSAGRIAIVLLPIAFVTTFVCAFILVSDRAYSQVSVQPSMYGSRDTLNVYPTDFDTQTWSGVEHVLSSDLSEDELYQSFSARNSAYVPLPRTIIPESEIQQEPPQTAPSEGDQSSTTTQESTQSPPSPETEESEELLTPEPESAEQTNDAVGETTVFRKAGESLFVLFQSVADIFSFANSGTSTPLQEEPIDAPATQTETESVVPSSTPQSVPTVQSVSTSTDSAAPEQTATDSASGTAEVTLEQEQTTSSPAVASSSQNSAPSTTTPVQVVTSDTHFTTHSITMRDFSVPRLKSGEYITGVQLRASLAGQYDPRASTSPAVLTFTYRTPSSTQEVGRIVINEEVSNALNGGYFLFALPQIREVEELANVEVTVAFTGDVDRLDGMYLDAVWLEVDTERFTRADLQKRASLEALGHLKRPDVFEMISETLDYTRGQSVNFNLKYHSQRNVVVQALREFFRRDKVTLNQVRVLHSGAGQVQVRPNITVTKDGLVSLSIPKEELAHMPPGRYTIELDLAEGGLDIQDSFDFQWGIISVNPDQTQYQLGDTTTFSFGAITPNGNTLCNANLRAFVIDEDEFISRVDVEQSGKCFGNNVTDVPDYTAVFVPNKSGVHEIYVERVDDSGAVIGHTSDTFMVEAAHNLWITREGPTRIYPPSPYPMELTVSASESFSGTLTERVPASFEIIETDAVVTQRGEYLELTWDVDLLSNTSETFSYSFDAPDISPILFLLGPASLSGNSMVDSVPSATSTATTTAALREDPDTSAAFEEHRQWQIASDAVGNMVLLWDNGSSVPADWTCLSCTGGAFYQAFPMGSSTASTTGGALTHTHTAAGSVLATGFAAVSEGGATDDIAPNSHTHTLTPSIGNGSNVPRYRDLRLIMHTAGAGEPATIPAGAIGIFDVASSSLPSNWYRYGDQDGYYVRGDNVPGATGGSNTHSHTITGTTGPGNGTAVRDRGNPTQVGVANLSHTHTINSSTPSVNIEPPYIEVVLAQLSTDGVAPNGLIGMWTEEVGTGWLDVSSLSGDPFHGRFLKASTTYGGTGGTATHAHNDVSNVVTSAAIGTEFAKDGAFGASDTHTHNANITNFTTVDNLPPFVTVVFGKRQGSSPVYEQLSYRWYVNTNAQTPTDPWPSGGSNLLEGEPIDESTTKVKSGDVLRLRMNAAVSNATATAEAFKLQYKAGSVCSVGSSWVNVGDTSSSTVWRGYNNAAVNDHSTLTSTILASTTVAETYEENGYATNTPNAIPADGVGEWDFVLQNNSASPGTTYCFRMVEYDGTTFTTYSDYASLITNGAPAAPTQSVPFDNEKAASTTVHMRFVTSDPESEVTHYQVQIDTDTTFSSPLEDRNSISNDSQFTNVANEANKAPFTSGQLIEFEPSTTFVDGTTYYWRTRSRDPGGSNQWGEWSEPFSFTVDTGLTVSAWYQTEEEQFDTNTLVDLETPSADYVDLATGSSSGTMTTGAIDFADGTLGTAWGRFYFDDDDPSGVISYQIQYLNDSSVWTLIPNSDLPGNSSGLTATTSLLDLDVETYDEIRLVATFSGSAGSPRINSWTVEWGYRVETPTITRLFPNEKVGTTTPVFEFTTTDPQSDPLVYEISWSSTPDFTSSTTRNSSIAPTGFSNIDDQGDSSPFTSGETIQYTIQGADALVDGETYWWRVRAKDAPPGDDTWSFWTDARSFTVATDTVVSTWFQTTQEQFNTNILSGTVGVGADAASVATTASEAMLVYGEALVTTPRYRLWDGSSWSSEDSLQDIGAPTYWAMVKAGTTREEYVALTIGSDADVNAQVYSNGEWGNLQEFTANMGNISARGADIAYETLSGDAMVVYCNAGPDPSYYVWDGTDWTAGGSTINLGSTNNCEWIKLASDPVSDEIILMSRDSDGTGAASYQVAVWNGSGWTVGPAQGGARGSAYETMALEYEESGDQALAISGDGNPVRFEYNSWNGGWAGLSTNNTISDNLMWAELVRDVGTDAMTMCYVDETVNIGAIRWTGAGWTGQTDLDAAGNAVSDRAVSCVYETTVGRDGNVMAVYSDTTNVRYQVWNGATWVSEQSVSTVGDSATVQLRRTGVGTILGMFFDDVNDDLLFSAWDGSQWSTSTIIENNASVDTSPFGEPFMMAPRNENTEGTTIVSPGINFDDGSGPYWQEMSWVDSTPGASTILYSVQYYDSASSSWKFVPDSEIPGNAAGTSTSPIDLSGLNKNTYNILRPYAALACDGSGNCPLILDWTVTWAGGITVAGSYQTYDQVSNKDSGTVAVAVNGVLQTGKTGAVSNGAWSIQNVTAFPGDIVTTFISGTSSEAEAVGVTRYDGSGNINGIKLYERHLSLGSNDATSTPLTNVDITQYTATNNEDVFIDLSGSTLNVCADSGCGDARLYVTASTTFRPGGNILTHDVQNDGTLIATTTLYVSGSWDNNGASTLTNSTVHFTATSSSETIDSAGAATPFFNNVTFGTTTGSASWTPQQSLDVNGALYVLRGTLARGSSGITVAGNLTTGANGFWTGIGTTTFDGSGSRIWSDQNAVMQNIGNVVVNGSIKTVSLGSNVSAQSITIGADDTLDASASHYDITVYGNWVNNNTFVPRNGEVFFAATTSNRSITVGGDAFYDLTFTGAGGGWAFTESTLTVNNDLSISAGTVTMPSATTTLAGSFNSAGGTFMHSNSAINFTSSGAETITASGTALTNAFYNLYFSGSGSWTFQDVAATSSQDVTIQSGTVTFPSGSLSIGGSLRDTGGAFTANSGEVRMFSVAAETIQAGGSSFYDLTTVGSGSWSFSDANATIANDLLVSAGTLTLPSGVLSVGGSVVNSSTIVPNGGEVLFNSSDTGETIDFGSSSMYDVRFDSATGGWTITDHASTTNDFTLSAGADFTLASGQILSVGGTFLNQIGGASTTWSGSTLSLENGTYSVNTKAEGGDEYDTLRIDSTAHISLWNSRATTTTVVSGGFAYSQDHASIDGNLYIYGDYARSTGTEYWSYATDFDGTDLSGGSERQAHVRFAGGATADITDGVFHVRGSSTATTTIANQGSGTYTISVSSGTANMRYYDFADLGSTGVSLLDGVTITSLADGAYEPASAGASGLTVSSSTIDANPELQIYRVGFASTSPIDVYNVTQSGGTSTSFWWFRQSRGNADGEDNDNDTGNPGTIRWDDSALQLTIEGRVYDDDESSPLGGTTCDGDAQTPIRVVVGGTTSYDGECAADGTYSISGVTIIGDPVITVFLNNAAGGERAVAVTKTATADILDMDLYVNRVIVRHEDTEAMTVTDMSAYDQDDNSFIPFVATSGSLTVLPDTELHVWATSTFTPGGTVTLQSGGTGNAYDGSLHLANGATFTGAGTTTYTIGGTFTLGNGATFVPASSTVVMSATTTGKAITTESDETLTLNALQFSGIGGAWNINGNISASGGISVATGTITGTGDITVTNGSFSGNGLVSLGGGEATIERSNTLGGIQAWTFNDLTLGNGVVVGTTTPASAATTTVGGTLTIQTGHFLDAGASRFDLAGSGTAFIENGTFLEDSSRVRYSGSAATNVISTGYYDLVLSASAGSPTYTATGLGIVVGNDLIVGGESTTTITLNTNDPALDVNGDLHIHANGTFIASNSGSLTLAGSYDNDGVFTGSGGTATFDGSGTHTIAAGQSSFSTLSVTGTGDFTISEHATATANMTLSANVNSFALASGQSLAVGGMFSNALGGAATTWTDTTLYLYGGGNYAINTSSVVDTYGAMIIGTDTDIRMWNSSASLVNTQTGASLYSMDHANIDGDLYIYGSYEKTSGTDHWSYATDFDSTDLSGGSERKVDVYIEGADSVAYRSGGALSVIGTAGNVTTVQNQGSGVYSFTIGTNGSTTMNHYEFMDMDADGLTFSGTPNVSDISHGYFLVANDSDSAITVGGTAINNNPALTFQSNVFATSSGVSTAVNVTATGTSVSSWRFTSHSGDIDGENFNVDPDGDPGYIVWDDSAASITVSGRVYSDEGSSVSTVCDSSTQNITLSVNGQATTSTSCNGDGLGGGTGLYAFNGISYSPGETITVFIDGEAQKAVTITEDPVSSINNMDLYENRVIVRHESSDPLSIADMAIFDSSDDGDIPFTAVNGVTDTLTLPADTKLIVWNGKEFEPGGNVTLSGGGGGSAHDGSLELYNNSVWTANGSELLSVGGSMVLGTGATFSAANSTTTFTTTAAARTIDINNGSFYNVAFTGSGSWSIADTAFDLNNFAMSAGTLTLPTGTTTVSGSFNTSGGALVHNGSLMLFDTSGSNRTVAFNGSTIGSLQFDGTGSWNMTDVHATSSGSLTILNGTVSFPSGTLTLGGSLRNTGGAITHNTSEVIIATSSVATVLASSSDLYALTFTGAGTFSVEDEDLTLLDSLTISSGSLTLASGTLAIGGSFDASGGTFVHATGSVLFNSSDAGETIDPGVSEFYNVNFGSASGGWTITGNATATQNFTLSSAAFFTQQSGTRLYVGNVFTNSVGGAATTWNGSTIVLDAGLSYAINASTTAGDAYDVLQVGANTDISMWYSQATTTTVADSGSVYSMDHANVDGALNIYGDYHITTGTRYWNYARDFDGTDLTGGNERAVTVSIAANATTTVDGGSLQMVGAAGNRTTVQNQGSGTYALSVTAGTFNAQQYTFTDINASGLAFSGAPTVTSLSNGSFELAVDTGSLITLASTTLNANASKVITGVSFATTTAISGTNVYLQGTTSNAWTFVSHTGNLDGENYDQDGPTACGSLRWDDSSCLLVQQTHYRWRNDDGGLGVPNTEWYNSNWDKRKSVRIDNPNTASTTNAVVELSVAYDGDMQLTFDDLRFTSDDGTTLIPHFIATSTTGASANVWIQVPTLAASDLTTVYMYYDNPSASSTSSSTDTFIAADDFEDGDIDEYSGGSGDLALFDVDGDHVYGGDYGLNNTDNDEELATDGIFRFDQTVSRGETIRYMQYVDTSGGADEVCTLFGVQSPGTTNQNYAVCIEQKLGFDDFIALAENVTAVATPATIISSTTVAFTSGWYEIEIDWQDDGSIDVYLYDDTGAEVATLSDSDASISSGGMGFTYWYNSGGWDNYTSRPYLPTEPTVYFGAEQIDGGASWAAAQNTKGVYAANDVARLRIAVENSGLGITNQTFDVEFAAKDSAPSCEAVLDASYTTVPNQASCGSSPICMQTTSNFANFAATADLLTGTEGTYVAGQAIESPSYTTGNLDVDQNEYTELEYALTPTSNASSSAYCLRVTDAGGELDTYLSVAELEVRFDPSVSTVALNGGAPIQLAGGTTTRVWATTTVTDLNGAADLVQASTTIYRSGAGAACTADDNDCYIAGGAPQCVFNNCSGNSCDVACYVDIWYHADPTDDAPYEGQDWLAYIEVVDQQGGIDIGSSPGVELISLVSLTSDGAISYGALAVSSSTGAFNPTTTIQNIGNRPIDINLEGTNLTDGASSQIPTSQQLFATSTFNYAACVYCTQLSTSTITNYEVDLTKPTSSSTPVTDVLYWGIEIPFGVASNPHGGLNTFYAVND